MLLTSRPPSTSRQSLHLVHDSPLRLLVHSPMLPDIAVPCEIPPIPDSCHENVRSLPNKTYPQDLYAPCRGCSGQSATRSTHPLRLGDTYLYAFSESLLRSVAFSMRCVLTPAGHWVRQHSESASRPQRYRSHLLNAVSDVNPSHTSQQSFSRHPPKTFIAIRNLGGEVWIQNLISAV